MFGQLLANKNKIATMFNSDSGNPIQASKHDRGRGGSGGADEIDLSLPRVPTRAPYAGERKCLRAHVPDMGKEEKDRRWILPPF
jgi:hypothetical protein